MENDYGQSNPVRLSLGFLSSMLGLTVLAGIVGGAPQVQADNVESVTVKINVTCTMSGFDNTYNVSVNPGQTTSDIGPTNIKTVCNDGNGYALYAIGYSGDSYYGNNTKLIGTNGNIDTGTSSSAGNNSYWAMKLSPVTGTYAPTIMNSFDSYHAVPSDFTMVAKYTAATDAGENAEGSTAQAYYEVKSSASQTADTYSGKVKYVLVHPNDAATPIKPLPDSACPAQSICYAPNTNDTIGTMTTGTGTRDLKAITANAQAGRQTTLTGSADTAITNNSTPTLVVPNYSREGYGFAGWSTDFEATPTSKVYGPNETITTSTTAGAGDADVSTKGLILYPVWVASAGNLQGWNNCNTLTQAPAPSTGNRATLASMTALTDQRDGNTYTVARLADGNCWMTENLRLDADDSADASLAQGFGDDTANNRGKFVGLPTSENANFNNTDPPVANNLYSTDGSNGTMNINTTNYPYARIPRYNNNNTNRTLTASYNGTGSSTYYHWYSYGNYYNWPAAIANTTYVNTNNQPVTSTSICPTGWRLPQGGDKTRIESDDDNDFWNLVVDSLNNNVLPANYNSQTQPYYTGSTEGTPVSNLVRAFPNNFLYSGYLVDSSASNRGSRGAYWSSSASSSYYAYSFGFTSALVTPGTDGSHKSNARAVRCLLGS